MVDLYQDGTHYFDYHHTPNDTLYAIDPAALHVFDAATGALRAILPDPYGRPGGRFGTAVAVYNLWVLNSFEVEPLFKD